MSKDTNENGRPRRAVVRPNRYTDEPVDIEPFLKSSPTLKQQQELLLQSPLPPLPISLPFMSTTKTVHRPESSLSPIASSPQSQSSTQHQPPEQQIPSNNIANYTNSLKIKLPAISTSNLNSIPTVKKVPGPKPKGSAAKGAKKRVSKAPIINSPTLSPASPAFDPSNLYSPPTSNLNSTSHFYDSNQAPVLVAETSKLSESLFHNTSIEPNFSDPLGFLAALALEPDNSQYESTVLQDKGKGKEQEIESKYEVMEGANSEGIEKPIASTKSNIKGNAKGKGNNMNNTNGNIEGKGKGKGKNKVTAAKEGEDVEMNNTSLKGGKGKGIKRGLASSTLTDSSTTTTTLPPRKKSKTEPIDYPAFPSSQPSTPSHPEASSLINNIKKSDTPINISSSTNTPTINRTPGIPIPTIKPNIEKTKLDKLGSFKKPTTEKKAFNMNDPATRAKLFTRQEVKPVIKPTPTQTKKRKAAPPQEILPTQDELDQLAIDRIAARRAFLAESRIQFDLSEQESNVKPFEQIYRQKVQAETQEFRDSNSHQPHPHPPRLTMLGSIFFGNGMGFMKDDEIQEEEMELSDGADMEMSQ